MSMCLTRGFRFGFARLHGRSFHTLLWSLACVAVCCGSLLPTAFGDAATESQQNLLKDIKFLASDELEGRGVGSKGLDQAADYIREEFSKAGLNVSSVKSGAFQTFSMTTGAVMGTPNTLTLAGPEGKRIELKANADFVPASFGGSGKVAGDLVFCGYGIEYTDKENKDKSYDDFAGLDLKGKVAIILRRVPQQNNPHGPFAGPHGGISEHGGLTNKVSNAFGKGAAAVLFVNDPASGRADLEKAKTQVSKVAEAVADAALEFDAVDAKDAEKLAEARAKLTSEASRYKLSKEEVAKGEQDPLMKFGYGGSESSRSMPIAQITKAACDEVLKSALKKSLADLEKEIDSDLKPRSAVLTGWTADGTITIERTQAEVKNVIGVLEGEGPLAQETVVIGAHYDHVGRGGAGSLAPGSNEIHNGADDNASGSVSLLELARRLGAMSRKEKFPRRIVFIAFTGEETGLVGSARYTKEPVFPLESTVAMLNMDMVGRLSDEKLTIFGTGTSPVWNALVEKLGKELGFQLSLKPEGFGPSDHSSFYAKQIPVLHFFTGNHNDYHRPGDDWDKINVPGMQRVVDMIEKIAIDVVRTPDRPKYVAIANATSGLREGGSRPYFGSIPDFSSEMPGYALSGVAPGSPAEKGGLKAGDRIIQLGMQKIDNLNDFDAALRKFSAGETIDVTVMRGTEKVTVKVALGKPRG